MDKKDLAKYLDLANHHPEATEEDIKILCQKVKEFGFHSAFVNPVYVSQARQLMGDQGKVGTVISFPLGQEKTEIKIFAVREAVKDGADELDISMNVGWFKAGKYKQVLKEMKALVRTVRDLKKETIIKFIIETGLLTDEEIKKASLLTVESGADFVKTCSGMGPRGASLKDVLLIKEAIGDKAKIKVAGGIDTYQEAVDFVNAGAVQIGTSQAVKIISEER